MRATPVLRASFLAAILAGALSAHAVTVGLSSIGGFTATSATAFGVDESVVAQQGGYGALSTLTYSVVLMGLPPRGAGSYTGAGGTLNFDLVFATGFEVGTSQTSSGTWTATGGTGTYTGATGAGTFATSVTQGTSQPFDSFTIFRGDIQAVPEPASLAALGIGAYGLLRRRKNA